MDDLERYTRLLGTEVDVHIDRPLGSKHPRLGFVYETNYGYLPGTLAGDGSEIDAYVLGVSEAIDSFTGRCIAVIARRDDNEHKLVVASGALDQDAIREKTDFVEKYYDTFLVTEAGA